MILQARKRNGGVDMTQQWGSLPEIATALGSVLVLLGAAVRWLVTRMDAKEEHQDQREAAERAKLEAIFQSRISALEHLVENQGVEISRLRTENARYLRHVGILEGIMRAKGMDIPHMEGPSHSS